MYGLIPQSVTNRFQGVLITDGATSYAVFIYNCHDMEWSGNAIIGWQASSVLYATHSLSGTTNAKDVACLNTPTTSSSTLIYRVAQRNFGRGWMLILIMLTRQK